VRELGRPSCQKAFASSSEGSFSLLHERHPPSTVASHPTTIAASTHSQKKMEAEGIATSAISAFESNFTALASGATGMIPEGDILPVASLDKLTDLQLTPDSKLLAKTVVLKLNGGLGTGMGLDKAKSLLKVKGDDTFLDLTAKQVMQMRQDYGFKVKFMLMNSFSTSADTLDFFQQNYPNLAAEEGLEMLQNKVPKLDATTLAVRGSRNGMERVLVVGELTLPGYPVCVIRFYSLFVNVCLRFQHSPRRVRPIRPTNGALPVTVTCTPPWWVRVVSTSSWRPATSTCLCPTRIISGRAST
jgi:hypothetical protein